MKRPVKLKIEITCEVLPDKSLGQVEVSTSAPHRSGYCLRNPFDAQVFKRASAIINDSFKRREAR